MGAAAPAAHQVPAGQGAPISPKAALTCAPLGVGVKLAPKHAKPAVQFGKAAAPPGACVGSAQ